MIRDDINTHFSHFRSDDLVHRPQTVVEQPSVTRAVEEPSVPRHDPGYCNSVRAELQRLPNAVLACVPEPTIVKSRATGGITRVHLRRALTARGEQISDTELLRILTKLKEQRKVSLSKRKDGSFWIRCR